MNKKKCRAEICLATIFSTQALFTPVKTLFLLHFMMQTQDISFLKFVFTFASFVFELPSGYIRGIIGENGAGKTTFFRYIMEEKKHYRGRRVQERMQGCWAASMIPLIWISLLR